MLSGALAEGFGLLMIVPLATIALHSSNSALFRYAPWAAPWTPGQRFAFALGVLMPVYVGVPPLLLGAKWSQPALREWKAKRSAPPLRAT